MVVPSPTSRICSDRTLNINEVTALADYAMRYDRVSGETRITTYYWTKPQAVANDVNPTNIMNVCVDVLYVCYSFTQTLMNGFGLIYN